MADAQTIEGALAKIERILPDRLHERLQAVQAAVTFPPAPAAPQPPGEIMMRISVAAQQLRRVELRYQSRGGETVRAFDPYGLVQHWNRWYAVGWCHLREDVRVFRVDRIREAALADETFTRPAEFDSLQYVLETLATAPWGTPVEVLLETTLEDARRRIPLGTALIESTDGGVLVRSHVDRLDWLARALLTLECRFVIRKPPELRAALRRLADEAADLATHGE